MRTISYKAPFFEGEAFMDNKIKKISLDDYSGRWIILFFYPADFTFICPTELGEIAENYDEIKELNAEVISISTDTVFVHKAWHDSSETIKKIRFPMLSDSARKISKAYGTLIEDKGISLRATFLIDPEGIIKAVEFHDNDIGRNINETIRKLQAAKFVYENNGNVCPVNWRPGDKTLKPDLSLVGKI